MTQHPRILNRTSPSVISVVLEKSSTQSWRQDVCKIVQVKWSMVSSWRELFVGWVRHYSTVQNHSYQPCFLSAIATVALFDLVSFQTFSQMLEQSCQTDCMGSVTNFQPYPWETSTVSSGDFKAPVPSSLNTRRLVKMSKDTGECWKLVWRYLNVVLTLICLLCLMLKLTPWFGLPVQYEQYAHCVHFSSTDMGHTAITAKLGGCSPSLYGSEDAPRFFMTFLEESTATFPNWRTSSLASVQICLSYVMLACSISQPCKLLQWRLLVCPRKQCRSPTVRVLAWH